MTTDTNTLGYSHTQKAPLCLLIYALAAVFLALGWFAQDAPPIPWLFPPIGVLMLVIAASFHHLTVEDQSDVLSVRFGPIPLFRKTVKYSDIESVEVGRTLLLDGLGIHMSIRGGRVWNLWGRDCVVVHFRNGGTLRIGTDDAESLSGYLCKKCNTKGTAMEIDLYNLFLGATLPPEQLRKHIVGPFEVFLIENYENAVASVYRPASVNVSLQWRRVDPQPPEQDPAYPLGLLEQTVTRVDAVKGRWTVTGKAALNSTDERSILSRFPWDDNGVWDLCELLTFITGRRVVTHDMLERFDPNRAGDTPCVLAEALVAASVAWGHRQSLVDNGFVYALLSHNAACEYQFLQPKAAQYNTALNVLIDKWPLRKLPKIPQEIRESLAKAVEDVVANHRGLSDDSRRGYTPILRSRVMDGPYSMLDRLNQLLSDLGLVLPDDGDAVLTRVRYLNTVRNRLTHSGEMPQLKGMTQEQSDRYTVQIVGGVLQSINQMAIGKMLGFTASGVGSLSQDTTALRRFFVEGNWNNYPIETRSFSDWIEDPMGIQ
jgi:hypothetical protein